MASIGFATAQVNVYNVSKMNAAIDQYKYKMAQMKEALRKEQGEGREEKRKYDATLSDLERLQEVYQVLEAERDPLVLPNNIISWEKKYLQGKIAGPETQRASADKES